MVNRLKYLRKTHKKTQQEMANYLGLSQQAYSTYENETRTPPTDMTVKLATFFKVSIDYLLGRTDTPMPKYEIPSSVEIINYPVIGYIRAGYGGEAIEQETGEIQEVPRSIMNGHKPSDFFVLEVKGDSMYPELREGDRVLVRKCDSIDSGSIGVVLYNGNEATIKKIVYKYGENWFDMVPINPMFKTVRIEGPALQECKVLGLVVYLFRKMN